MCGKDIAGPQAAVVADLYQTDNTEKLKEIIKKLRDNQSKGIRKRGDMSTRTYEIYMRSKNTKKM